MQNDLYGFFPVRHVSEYGKILIIIKYVNYVIMICFLLIEKKKWRLNNLFSLIYLLKLFPIFYFRRPRENCHRVDCLSSGVE